MAAKRKASASAVPPLPKRRASSRVVTDPNVNGDIIDAPNATRASPDSDVNDEIVPGPVKQENRSESSLSDIPAVVEAPKKKKPRGKKATAEDGVKKAESVISAVVDAAENAAAAPRSKAKSKAKDMNGAVAAGTSETQAAKKSKPSSGEIDAGDPEAEGEKEADEEEIKEALSRPPPVNSDYLPLPWKGRLGYACLNTYLRQSNPPVFSSRTCRIASILEHRHPLKDPSQPEHATKNRPDRSQPASVERGQQYVEAICLQNVKDIIKMVRWNDRYHIKFLRLSSEMFPFASHPEYGYKLAPFASEALAEAGKVIAELGHRVTTHPGQFTQLGSPRKSVIDNALRDLVYHDEMLSLLNLPDQMNKDAVMILHMGGVFDGKAETLARFRENYKDLPQSVKNRLVLENDDVSWSVHDLLPVCEELNIPMVLDYHHHNIIFDASQIREGTKDIMDLYPRIKATWDRKGIKQKMHYSEPTPAAITGRQRRKHSPRVATLPPCAPDMDLMIEAKDKEQAVFELMRTFKLPGYDSLNDILPYVRNDDNKAASAELAKAGRKKATPKKKSKKVKEENEDEDAASVTSATPEPSTTLVPEKEVGMGGPEGRVYWPPTMEEWLRPKKRVVKPKEEPGVGKLTAAQKKKAAADYAAVQAAKRGGEEKEEKEESESDVGATPATKKAKAAMRAKDKAAKIKAAGEVNGAADGVKKEKKPRVKKEAKTVPTPSPSEDEMEELEPESGDEDDVPITPAARRKVAGGRKTGGRAAKGKVSYKEEDAEMEEA